MLEVSIPFKRESVSKVCSFGGDAIYIPMFQFPSNGKAYPKEGMIHGMEHELFHFGFQFPSNGKAYPKVMEPTETEEATLLGFNSLQTGKRIQRKKDS